ncbi:DUF6681 family protein [Weissella soli]|uniref:DUF6681 family protein n=1 Tax=Weissella soli TaxID=155866 RepID=UPI0035A0949F
MLTILDLLNHYLGFFNVNTRWKGKIYTILATVGDFYIAYLAVMFYLNKNFLRGTLLVGAFLVIMYFAILNFVYYFTNKTVKWDISPKVEKYLGTQEKKEFGTHQSVYVPANGLYKQNQVLPTTVISDADMQAELQKLADQLLVAGLMHENYNGLSSNEQIALMRVEKIETIYANHPGTPIPYFTVKEERDGLAIYGGVNEMMASRLGRIMSVGLMPIEDALRTYELYPATVTLTGGKGHSIGRSSVIQVQNPYQIQVELAFKKKA